MFFFIYGVVKKPRYNRNLAISELVVNGCSIHSTTHKRKRDRELASLKPVPRCIRARYNGVSLYTLHNSTVLLKLDLEKKFEMCMVLALGGPPPGPP